MKRTTEVRQVKAAAICPMSDCIRAHWIFRICDCLKEDYFFNALSIGAFPFFSIRPFLKYEIGDEVEGLDKALETLKIPYQDLTLTIKEIQGVFEKAFRIAERKWRARTRRQVSVPLPLLNDRIHPVYICPVNANWSIDEEVGYGEPYGTSVAESTIGKSSVIFCKPPKIRTKKEMDVWCEKIAGAIARGIAVDLGVFVYSSAWEIEGYKSKSLSEIEDLIRKERGWVPTPSSKGILAENVVKEYFAKQNWDPVPFGDEDKSLDEWGIDFVFFGIKRRKSFFATVQVESSLTFSKMKKFNENSEKLFIEVIKPRQKDANLQKYYITKEFDEKSKEFAKENGVSLITFNEIAKTLPRWKAVLREQKLI